MIILIIDPSGTGTTGILLIAINNNKLISYEFLAFKNGDWKEHLNYLVNLVKEKKPNIIIYENTTYIYGRQHQGTVGLYKLIGGIVGLQYSFDFIKEIDSIAVNQVKPFKKKLFQGTEQLERLTCQKGRGKGWKYCKKRISLHQLDALIIYHLWSGGSLESKKSLKKKITELKKKKRLGIRQKEKLERLNNNL